MSVTPPASSGKRSIVLVTNIPNHYRIPLFNELNEQLRTHLGLELIVLFAAETYARRRDAGRSTGLDKARFEWRILKTVTFSGQRPLFIPLGLRHAIRSIEPEAIMVGGTGMLAVVSAVVTRTRAIPLVVWSGETKRGSRTVRRLKTPLKKLILKRASAAVSYGSVSAEFLHELAPELPVFIGWNTTELTPFLDVSQARDDHHREDLELITVGDLTSIKGHHYLLEALSRVEPSLLQKVSLTVIGDGPLRRELEERTRELGLSNRTTFRGAIGVEEVPSVLGSADVFVFPSLGDVWGLALLEAMAAGLPVVTSEKAGATRDLVTLESGFVVDPTDLDEFGSALERVLSISDAQRDQMGKAGRALVAEKCSLTSSAAGFTEAVRHALS